MQFGILYNTLTGVIHSAGWHDPDAETKARDGSTLLEYFERQLAANPDLKLIYPAGGAMSIGIDPSLYRIERDQVRTLNSEEIAEQDAKKQLEQDITAKLREIALLELSKANPA